MEEEKKKWFLGIDDTDGMSGGCTTYTMTKIIDALHERGASFLGFPRLIRLNPNVPFKTRGNGALGLTFTLDEEEGEIKALVKQIIIEDTAGRTSYEEAQPTALLTDREIRNNIYHKSLTTFLEYQDYRFLQKYSVLGEMTRGAIGAFNAMFPDLSWDYTFEILLYRREDNLGLEREIDSNQVRSLSEKFKEKTFSSFDFVQNRELIAPSGPDPVFAGIRGEHPEVLKQFVNKLKTGEELEGYTIFITNQGTAVNHRTQIQNLDVYNVISSEVTVASKPRVIRGGHVEMYVWIADRKEKAMVFEPTKQLASSCSQLLPGDSLYIHGAYASNKLGKFISLEQVRVISNVAGDTKLSPMCKCGNRMESAGFLKGYKCKKCGNRSWKPEIVRKRRNFYSGQVIYASKSAQRHLTRPWERELRRNRGLKDTALHYEDFRRKF